MRTRLGARPKGPALKVHAKAPRAYGSIARSAPLGAAAPLPQGGHASARSDNEPVSEAGGRMGVARDSTATPIVGVSPGGAHSSSRLAPTTLTQVSR